MAKRMVAYCGLVCTDCLAYIATQKNDDKLRQEVVDKWTKKYKHQFKVADINCDGCVSASSRVIGNCAVCQIRQCGREKGVVNCAYCAEYPCAKLAAFFKVAPLPKKTLDAVKKGMH